MVVVVVVVIVQFGFGRVVKEVVVELVKCRVGWW